MRGRVRMFDPNRGFGFIEGSDGHRDYYFRASSIAPLDQRELRPGTGVQFDAQATADNRRRAINVRAA